MLRIDSGVRDGDRITHYYDSLLMKVIAHGPDRPAETLSYFQLTELTQTLPVPTA